jgi:hypothetical protein
MTVARKLDGFPPVWHIEERDYRLSRERQLKNERILQTQDSFIFINSQDALKLRTISRRSGLLPYINR